MGYSGGCDFDRIQVLPRAKKYRTQMEQPLYVLMSHSQPQRKGPLLTRLSLSTVREDCCVGMLIF